MRALLVLLAFAGAALAARAPHGGFGQGQHPLARGPKHRRLLGYDGAAFTEPLFVNSTGTRAGLCTVVPTLDPNDDTYQAEITSTSQFEPTGSGALGWPIYPSILDEATNWYIGELVVDNKICVDPLTDNPVLGASAQDFGTDLPAYANWESYGWQQFKTGKASWDSHEYIIVTTLQLWLIGTRATGSSSTCTATDVSVAVFADDAGSPSGAAKYSSTATLNNTFVWAGNVSSVVTVDITPWENAWVLNQTTTYWLRVKVKAPYTSTDRCFVFWATTASTSHNTPDGPWANARWQEAVGGAGGYSTNCVGAKLDALNADAGSLPGADQSLYACFNGGVKTTGTVSTRRCLSYKNQFTPALTCAAPLNQFVFALLGWQGQPITGWGGR